MDKLDGYRQIVRRIIEQYARYKPSNGEIDNEIVIDPEHNHYELLSMGFDNGVRVHHCVYHLDIIDGKVWIQHDATNWPIADELLAAGNPREDIVLGFHPAKLRKHTEFAVG